MKGRCLLSAVVACAVVATTVALAVMLNVPQLLAQLLLDSTPRTGLTAAGLVASFRAALPPESIGLLALSAVAAAVGIVADQL